MSQQINLFSPVFLKQKKYFSVLTMLQALGLIVLGSALFYGYAVYQVGALTKQTEESSKRYAAEQARLARFAAEFSPQQSTQLLQEELRQAEAKLAAQQELIDTLKSGVIGNTTGYSEYMRAFARQVVHGLWLTGFNITGDAAQMSMSGAVLSPDLVPVYIQRLSHEKVMQGKSFAALQMQRPKADGSKVEYDKAEDGETEGMVSKSVRAIVSVVKGGKAENKSEGTKLKGSDVARYVEFTLQSVEAGEAAK